MIVMTLLQSHDKITLVGWQRAQKLPVAAPEFLLLLLLEHEGAKCISKWAKNTFKKNG